MSLSQQRRAGPTPAKMHTDMQSIDRVLQTLVVIFFSTVASPMPKQVGQRVSFPSALLPVIFAISTTECFRPRKQVDFLPGQRIGRRSTNNCF